VLGQYNNQLLQWLPRAQYWVNISVAYREKMIPLYVLYQGIFWFIFVSTIGIEFVFFIFFYCLIVWHLFALLFILKNTL
jgi:hypothetical protein